MTVSSTTARANYTGNGTTTVFAVPFYFLAAADLRVILRTGTTEAVQSLTTNYTVTGAGNENGGSVTMLVAPAAGTTLTILRNAPATQETDLLPNDRLPAESLEDALDKLTMLVQQVDEVADRALQFPASDPAASPTLPVASARASKFLSFNASGLPVATVGVDASLDIFTQAGAGAVPRSVNSKLRDTVSVKDFGAVGDGVTDDTAAIQAAVDAARIVYFPSGSYRFSRILLRHDNCALVGDGQFRTFLVSTVTTGAAIFNPDQATVTRYYCSIRGMQISTPNMTAPSGSSVIDWRSIQFGELNDLWLIGNNATGQAGIILGTITFGVTECTYNYIQNIYIGFVGYGVLFYDGANTNTLMNMRVQPGANSFGYHLAFGTGADRIGNNTFIACHCEFPGNTVTGYALGTGAKNTTIIAPRIEGLATGIQIDASALNTTVLNPYFDSTTTNVSNASSSTCLFGPNGFSLSSSAASPNWGTEINYSGFPGGVVRFKGATGGEIQTFNDATAVRADGTYGSTYSGGTVFGVGANGFFSSVTGGDYGIGTSDANWLGLASNGTIRAKVQPNGAVNFVPLAADPAGAVAGDVYYNSGTNKLRCYNGTSWFDLF